MDIALGVVKNLTNFTYRGFEKPKKSPTRCQYTPVHALINKGMKFCRCCLATFQLLKSLIMLSVEFL